MNICLTFVFSIFLLASFLTQAKADDVIFKCKSKHNMFDPHYIQGSEIYLEVLHNHNKKQSYIIIDPPESKKTVLVRLDENTKSNFNIKDSLIYIEWLTAKEKMYMSLVYLDKFNWGAALHLSNNAKKRVSSLKKQDHIELHCSETKYFKLIKNKTSHFSYPASKGLKLPIIKD